MSLNCTVEGPGRKDADVRFSTWDDPDNVESIHPGTYPCFNVSISNITRGTALYVYVDLTLRTDAQTCGATEFYYGMRSGVIDIIANNSVSLLMVPATRIQNIYGPCCILNEDRGYE